MEKTKNRDLRSRSIQYENAFEIINQSPQQLGNRRATVQGDTADFQQVVGRLDHLERRNSKVIKLTLSHTSSQMVAQSTGMVTSPAKETSSSSGVRKPSILTSKDVKAENIDLNKIVPDSIVAKAHSVERDFSQLALKTEIVFASLPIMERIYSKAHQELGRKSEYVIACGIHLQKIKSALE